MSFSLVPPVSRGYPAKVFSTCPRHAGHWVSGGPVWFFCSLLSEFHRQSYLRKSVVIYEFGHVEEWIKETVQCWPDKIGSVAVTETVVSREQMITYY